MLGLAHMCTDMCQGAVPALLPFLADQRGYSFTALGSLILAATIGSSLVQPIFGLVSDRVRQPWLMPMGLLLAGCGLAVVGLVPGYGFVVGAIAMSGLGVAAFHPEGARLAGVAAGERRGRGMSLFSVGGNAGFALGPLTTTPLVLVFGLPGTVGLVVLPALMSVVLLRELGRLGALDVERRATATAGSDHRPDEWGPFARLGAVVALRSGVYFGLQSFVPLWFVTRLHSTEGVGNGALTAMLIAGALGTLAGGGLVDRVGPRVVLVGTMALSVPLLVAFPFAGPVPAFGLLAAIGMVTIASFSVTVVMGQQYLPNRLGLASGVTLGLAIGVGGLVATALGALADAHGLTAVMSVIASLPIPAALLALTLPRESTAPRRMRRSQFAAAGPG